LFQQEQVSKAIWPYTVNHFATADSVPGYPTAIFLLDQRRIDRDVAGFGELTVDLTEKLSVLGGIRVYDYRNGLKGYYGFASAKCVSGAPFQGAPCLTFDKNANGSGETHKLNATYRFDPDRLGYFTYSTGFRPGGINRNPAYGPYGADQLNNFELGWKTGWFGNHLHWNGALYYETWSNFQFSFQGPNGTSIYQSGPSASVKGLETALDWALNKQFNVSLAGTYNDSKIRRDFCGIDAQLNPIRNCAGQTIQVADGTPLPYAPKFKGSVTARYGFNLFGLNAHVQGALSYRGSIPLYLTTNDIAAARSGFGIYRLGSFATTDFLAGVDKNGYRFEIFVKNLFDTHGALNAATSCPLNVCGTKSVVGVPQALYVSPVQPLTLGIKIGKEF
jgi:outer membrane receptor protein involved in Fe transport